MVAAITSTADVIRDVWSKHNWDTAFKTTPEEQAMWDEFAASFVPWLKDHPPSCDPEGDEALAIFHGAPSEDA
jgi:hypothetical protein